MSVIDDRSAGDANRPLAVEGLHSQERQRFPREGRDWPHAATAGCSTNFGGGNPIPWSEEITTSVLSYTPTSFSRSRIAAIRRTAQRACSLYAGTRRPDDAYEFAIGIDRHRPVRNADMNVLVQRLFRRRLHPARKLVEHDRAVHRVMAPRARVARPEQRLEPPRLIVVNPRPKNMRRVPEDRQVGKLPAREPRVVVVAHIRSRDAIVVRGRLFAVMHAGRAVDAIAARSKRREQRTFLEDVADIALQRSIVAIHLSRQHRRYAHDRRGKRAGVIRRRTRRRTGCWSSVLRSSARISPNTSD